MTIGEVVFLLLGVLAGGLVVLGPGRRWSLGGLALAYLTQALILESSGASIAAGAKLIAGWIACAILLMTVGRQPGARLEPGSGWSFRGLAVLLVALAAGGLGLNGWATMAQIPHAPASVSGLWMGVGLLGLGMAGDAFGAGVALLLAMAGFEAAYGLMETSLAVLALLAMIQVGVALVVSYMTQVAEAGSGDEAKAE
jgi:hypothetical protein